MIEAWLKRPNKINQRIGIQTFNGYQYFFFKKKVFMRKGHVEYLQHKTEFLIRIIEKKLENS